MLAGGRRGLDAPAHRSRGHVDVGTSDGTIAQTHLYELHTGIRLLDRAANGKRSASVTEVDRAVGGRLGDRERRRVVVGRQYGGKVAEQGERLRNCSVWQADGAARARNDERGCLKRLDLPC